MIWIVSACLFTLLMIVMATSCSAEAVTEVMADDLALYDRVRLCGQYCGYGGPVDDHCCHGHQHQEHHKDDDKQRASRAAELG